MLNGKQTDVINEYVKDMNGCQSAIRAGYSAKSARTQAADLLTKPNIREKVDVALEERAKRAKIEPVCQHAGSSAAFSSNACPTREARVDRFATPIAMTNWLAALPAVRRRGPPALIRTP